MFHFNSIWFPIYCLPTQILWHSYTIVYVYCWVDKFHIFWEGHKNLAKSSPNFWPQNTQSKVRWRFHNFLWPSQNIWTLYRWCPFKIIFKNIIPVVTFQIGYIKNCPHPDILKMNAHFETDRTKGNRHFCLNPTGRNQPIYDNTR